jgi:hypothetical protein
VSLDESPVLSLRAATWSAGASSTSPGTIPAVQNYSVSCTASLTEVY